jgi:hypothetical protein
MDIQVSAVKKPPRSGHRSAEGPSKGAAEVTRDALRVVGCLPCHKPLQIS